MNKTETAYDAHMRAPVIAGETALTSFPSNRFISSDDEREYQEARSEEFEQTHISESEMSKLALDLGTRTGFAWSAAAGMCVSGVWDFRPAKFESSAFRYIRFRDVLAKLHAPHPLTMVWFEAVRAHKGVDAAHVYGGLVATLTAWCEENGIPYEGVPVGTIKKFWTGKGNANKEAMIAAAVLRGYEPLDDNEADAIALLTLRAPEIGPVCTRADEESRMNEMRVELERAQAAARSLTKRSKRLRAEAKPAAG